MAKKMKSASAETEVYCLVSICKTSKGPMHHGDRLSLPEDEADLLKGKGFVK